jgi:hypothetical protein
MFFLPDRDVGFRPACPTPESGCAISSITRATSPRYEHRSC